MKELSPWEQAKKSIKDLNMQKSVVINMIDELQKDFEDIEKALIKAYKELGRLTL